MNIFRNKENNKLYTIEYLIRDISHLNNNEFAGIYAIPYNWNGDKIVMKSKDEIKCNNFVKEKFTIVAHK